MKRIRRNRRFEAITSADSYGNKKLYYNPSEEEIPYVEFMDDIESIFPSKSSIVLKIAEEAANDEEEADRIIARGGKAIDLFYDNCQDMWDETNDGIVAILMPKHKEVTNFVYRLCQLPTC